MQRIDKIGNTVIFSESKFVNCVVIKHNNDKNVKYRRLPFGALLYPEFKRETNEIIWKIISFAR